MEVYESSEKLKSIKQRKESELTKFDFSKLNVGESCVIKINSVKESSLRSKVSAAKKKLGFDLVCTKHVNDGLFEIGRIK